MESFFFSLLFLTLPFLFPPPLTRRRFRRAGLAAFAITAPFLPSWKKRVAALQESRFLNALVKFGVVFTGAYHALGGMRHMAWDMVKLHDARSIVTSGRAAAGTAALLGLYGAFYE